MRAPLFSLVLLLSCLLAPGRGADCQGECLACGLLLQRQKLEQAFNTLVCLLECEGHVSSSLTWELCERAAKLLQYPLNPEDDALAKRTDRGLQLTSLSLDSDGELLGSAAMTHYRQDALEQRGAQYDSSPLGSDEEAGAPEEEEDVGLEDGDRQEREAMRDSLMEDDGGEEEEAEAEVDEDGSRANEVSKRFGGFQRGRHAYRKLMGVAPGRPLQKRYGGFIGIRKSARKWNNQKRMKQLLQQYLGMRSNRSGRFSVPATAVRRPNQL